MDIRSPHGHGAEPCPASAMFTLIMFSEANFWVEGRPSQARGVHPAWHFHQVPKGRAPKRCSAKSDLEIWIDCIVQLDSFGGFLSHRDTPCYHPFLFGSFTFKPSSYWRSSIFGILHLEVGNIGNLHGELIGMFGKNMSLITKNTPIQKGLMPMIADQHPQLHSSNHMDSSFLLVV